MSDRFPNFPKLPKIILLLVASGLCSLVASRVVAQTSIPEATAAARVEQQQKQARQVRPDNYDLGRYPVTDKNEKHWRFLLWTTAVTQPKETYVGEAVTRILALTTRSSLSPAQGRTVQMAMQVGTQLYLSDPSFYGAIGQQFQQTLDRSPDQEWVAMALSALTRAAPSTTDSASKAAVTPTLAQIQTWRDRAKSRFPNWQKNTHLRTTLQDVTNLSSPAAVPPLADLLKWTIAPNQVQMYVICQSDRWVVCRAVLKNRRGEFVRQTADPASELWSVPLLLRSVHGLSWNFTRGQTPQGIYRIESTVPQPDREFFRAFGQFPLVQLFVPFEAGAREFLPGKKGTFRGSIAAYQALLPASWRNYQPLQQSYWAGRAGRGLFRIHGTGEGLDFFAGKDRNPDSYLWNPTIGCLSALETYDESGQLKQSDMQQILNRLVSAGGQKFSGYLIVVDLPSSTAAPIDLATLESAIQSARP